MKNTITTAELNAARTDVVNEIQRLISGATDPRRWFLTSEEVVEELRFLLGCGAIAPREIDAATVALALIDELDAARAA